MIGGFEFDCLGELVTIIFVNTSRSKYCDRYTHTAPSKSLDAKSLLPSALSASAMFEDSDRSDGQFTFR